MNAAEFKTPGIEWRGKPFLSWNGRLEKDELLQQIDAMAAMDMGGFFMHSRTGLEAEYLGDAFWRAVRSVAGVSMSGVGWIK